MQRKAQYFMNKMHEYEMKSDEHKDISRLNVSAVNDQRALESPERANTKSKVTEEDRPRILRR